MSHFVDNNSDDVHWQSDDSIRLGLIQNPVRVIIFFFGPVEGFIHLNCCRDSTLRCGRPDGGHFLQTPVAIEIDLGRELTALGKSIGPNFDVDACL